MPEPPLLLYIETNFLMSIATGRDPDASTLLDGEPAGLIWHSRRSASWRLSRRSTA